MDLIAVEQPDKTIKCTSIKVKFGYLKIFNAKEKKVVVKVNGKVAELQLRLSESGDVYYPEEVRKYVSKDKLTKADSNDSEGGYLSASDNLSAFSQPQTPKKSGKLREDTPIKDLNLEQISDAKIQDTLKKDLQPTKTDIANGNQDLKIEKMKQNLIIDVDNPALLKPLYPKTPSYMISAKKLSFDLGMKPIEPEISKIFLEEIVKQPVEELLSSSRIATANLNTQDSIIDVKTDITDPTKPSGTEISNNSLIINPSPNESSKYSLDIEKNKSSNLSKKHVGFLDNEGGIKEEKDIYEDKLGWGSQYYHKKSNQSNNNNLPSNVLISNNFSLKDGVVFSDNHSSKDNQEKAIININGGNNENYSIISNENNHQTSQSTKNNSIFTVSQEYSFQIKNDMPKMFLEISNCWNNVQASKNIEEEFNKNTISEEEFMKDPWSVINSKNLAIKFEDCLYNWKAICPMIMSYTVFGKPLPLEVLNKLTETEKGFFTKLFGTKTKNNNVLKLDTSKMPLPRKFSSDFQKKNFEQNNLFNIPNIPQNASGNVSTHGHTSSGDFTVKELNTDNIPKESIGKIDDKELRLFYRRVFILTSDQLKSLNLNKGKNDISFTVYSRIQGEQSMSCNIYLWDFDDKIVVSDVDGTITRSDFLGHVFPIFGKDWTHKGIICFYNKIFSQGYKILYLSARALCQSESTKKFLFSLKQENQNLPEGPVILSPDGLTTSFKREVIDRTPHNFKIACLHEILSLFPDEEVPFYAGFGNRPTVNKLYIYI